jgi:Leucine-rich repeat (LRR) protein
MKMQLSKLPILTVKLEKLIASYNLIEEIPSYLPNLKYLDLSNNLI